MRVTNTSPFPTEGLKELLKFAARGVKDAGVEVHVKGSNTGWRGRAYTSGNLSDYAYVRVAETSDYLITIGIARMDHGRTWNGCSRIQKLWPDGIPLESWQDAFVWIAAHEFRHVWQAQRKRRTGKAGKLEYDAEKFALKRLNEWREATGRTPVPPVKQPNPFSRKDNHNA